MSADRDSDNEFGWIWLRNLPVDDAHVGIYAHEQRNAQPLIIDVGLWANTAHAAAVDEVSATVDWAVVAEAVLHTTRSKHYRLIETLCETLAGMLLERFGVSRVRVQVCKPESLVRGMAQVCIERHRPHRVGA